MAFLSANDCLIGKKFVINFVISDAIKNGLLEVRHDITRGTEVDGQRHAARTFKCISPETILPIGVEMNSREEKGGQGEKCGE